MLADYARPNRVHFRYGLVILLLLLPTPPHDGCSDRIDTGERASTGKGLNIDFT